MANNAEKLTCVSIIICDDIYRDERTKKLVIVGTFSTIQPITFPHHQKLHILMTLTNGNGEYDVALRVVHEESDQAVVEVRGPMKIDTPLRITEINVPMVVPLTAAGKYWVEVISDGEILAQRPFIVSEPLAPASE